MRNMMIAIPTKGRGDFYRHVVQFIPRAWRGNTFLVAAPEEYQDYAHLLDKYEVNWLDFHGNGIRDKRIVIAANAPEKFLMLDDDIIFYHRPWEDSVKLRNADEDQIDELFQTIERDLDDYAHVGVSHREGNNRFEDDVVFNVRCSRALAYRREAYEKNLPSVQIMEDFDTALQLITKGFPLKVWAKWAQGQISTSMKGGCATYRTHEMQEQAAQQLADKFPGIVKLRKKKTKGGLGESTDVTIYWKKAYENNRRT